MSELDEIREKLQLSKEKLAALKKLLDSDPDNDTFLARRKDLEEVIALTEKVLKVKEAKSEDSAAARASKLSSSSTAAETERVVPREYGVRKEHYEIGERCQLKQMPSGKWFIGHVVAEVALEEDKDSGTAAHSAHGTFDSVSSLAEMSAEHLSGTAPNTVQITGIESLMAAQSSAIASDSNSGAAHPLRKDALTQSSSDGYDNFFRAFDPSKAGGRHFGAHLHAKSADSQYRIQFMDRRAQRDFGEFYCAKTRHMRTYVPPLPSEIKEGVRCKCVWNGDGLFHRGTVVRLIGADEGNGTAARKYQVVFDKWESEECYASLYDIQLLRGGVAKESGTMPSARFLPSTALITKDKRGRLHIPEKAVIPEYLWSAAARSSKASAVLSAANGASAGGGKAKVKPSIETKDEMRIRQKKIKKIKSRHKQLVEEVNAQNRTHDWRQFLSKGMRKSKKKLRSSLVPASSKGRADGKPKSSGYTTFVPRTNFHSLKKGPKH